MGPRQARGRKSLILRVKRRFAIRAAKFGPETDAIFEVGERFHGANEKRGSFEGAIRIPLRSPSFLFNDFMFLRIPRKSLKSHSSLFSIPTTPTHHFTYRQAPIRPRQRVGTAELGVDCLVRHQALFDIQLGLIALPAFPL